MNQARTERVARAIYETNAGQWRCESWESLGEFSSTREAYMREAEAALKAARGKTDMAWWKRAIGAAGMLVGALLIVYGIGVEFTGHKPVPGVPYRDGDCWVVKGEPGRNGGGAGGDARVCPGKGGGGYEVR